ncbi:MAG TPA: ABC transporter ATP-binding protein [Patescibacteria group bacterium]
MDFLRTYKAFFGFCLRYRYRYLLFVIFLISLGVVESIQPYFYKLFIETIYASEFGKIITVLWIYVGVRVLNIIFDVATYTVGDWVLIPASRDARLGVVKKIHDLDLAFHQSKSTGSLISIIRRGDGAFFNLFHNFNQLARIFINFIVILAFFGSFNLEIAGLLVISFVINIVATKFLIDFNIKKRQVFNDSEDKVSGVIVDNLLNYETVKYFAKETWEYNRLKDTFKEWVNSIWGYSNSFRAIDIIVGFTGNIGLFLILLFSIQKTVSGAFSVGDFVLILGFISSFYPKFFDLLFNFRDMAKNYADIERYMDILSFDTQVKDPDQPKTIKNFKGDIEFKNISFSYPDGKKGAIKNLDLEIRPGQSIALVGKSGVGKTTLVKLLMRFFDLDEGEILIDGINIKDMDKSYLRSLMGVVPQDPNMFNDTIGFNIGYGKPSATKKEIIAAAKMANLHDFIDTLPKKYETVVGERGVKLSGGQRQRLAIARMILSDPGIIIFDEATSQLDSESEKYIQDAFWKAAKDKTTIIIAHRLSTVVKADKIVVMENNSIKEIGSHHELVNKKNSLYRHFWDLQTTG